MTPIEERSAREVHVAAFKAAKALGYCFECASEFGFRATEAMVPTKEDRGNMCSKQGCPSRRAARVQRRVIGDRLAAPPGPTVDRAAAEREGMRRAFEEVGNIFRCDGPLVTDRDKCFQQAADYCDARLANFAAPKATESPPTRTETIRRGMDCKLKGATVDSATPALDVLFGGDTKSRLWATIEEQDRVRAAVAKDTADLRERAERAESRIIELNAEVRRYQNAVNQYADHERVVYARLYEGWALRDEDIIAIQVKCLPKRKGALSFEQLSQYGRAVADAQILTMHPVVAEEKLARLKEGRDKGLPAVGDVVEWAQTRTSDPDWIEWRKAEVARAPSFKLLGGVWMLLRDEDKTWRRIPQQGTKGEG